MKVTSVRSAKDGPFMGGDWVLNSRGQGATLSFCFLNPEGTECFGLTVGHLTDNVGDSIFRFAESEPIPFRDDSNKEEYFGMFEIGTVVSISEETDSLVFKMNLKPDQCHPLRIALSNKSHITLNEDNFSMLGAPEKGTFLAGFGARRHGASGLVTEPSTSSAGACILKGDIGMTNNNNPLEMLTDGGDGGTIFCSVLGMTPFYFHHTLATRSDGTKVSYGVPLLNVLKAHEETRHLVPTTSSDAVNEPPKKKPKIIGSPVGEAREPAGLYQFRTRIVAQPTGAEVLKNPAKKETETSMEVPRTLTGSTDPRIGAVEDQTLPVFNVRVKTRTRD
ncbi:MAG: hypothetical protein SGILL_006437 [Bacillariaceae sp.]